MTPDIADCESVAEARISLQAALMALDDRHEREALDHATRAAGLLATFYEQTPRFVSYREPGGYEIHSADAGDV
jgi:hypothetical protein